MTRPPFERTECDCKADVQNCHREPGYLGPGDAGRIMDACGVSDQTLLFRRGRAVLGNAATGRRLEVATIVPGRVATLVPGRAGGIVGAPCVFLTAEDRCAIHAVAPFGCAYFDVHMATAEWQRRSLWALRLLAVDKEYRAMAAALLPKEERWILTACGSSATAAGGEIR